MNTQQSHIYKHQGIQFSAGSISGNDTRIADAKETLKCSMRGNEKIIVCLFEIRIPNSYMQGFFFDGNKLVVSLISYLKNIVKTSQAKREHYHDAVKKASVDAIWQARMTNGSGMGYRVALLLNPEAYYKQHPYKMPQEVVMDRIVHAWSRVSNQSASAANQQIYFPYGWIQDVESSRYGLEEIFPKISVLCGDTDSHNGAAFAGFGTTRRV